MFGGIYIPTFIYANFNKRIKKKLITPQLKFCVASDERYHYRVALCKIPHLIYNTSAQNGMTTTTEYIIDMIIVQEGFWLIENKITENQ